MAYTRGQQVLVNIDVNNPSGWDYRHTASMQWIKTVVVEMNGALQGARGLMVLSDHQVHVPSPDKSNLSTNKIKKG
eukprot:6575637-Ditylum_brightwellii.AAC.1